MTSKSCVDLLFHALYSNSSCHCLFSVPFCCCHIELLSAGETVAHGDSPNGNILSKYNNFCFVMLYIFYLFLDLKLFVLLMIGPFLAVFLLAKLIQASNYNIINSVNKKISSNAA